MKFGPRWQEEREPRRGTVHSALRWALFLTLLFGVPFGCGTDPTQERLDEIPRLHDDVRPLLEIEDDFDRAESFRRVGVTRVQSTWQAFDEYLGLLPASEIGLAQEELRLHFGRLGRSMADAFDYPAPLWWAGYVDTLSAESIAIREWARCARLRISYDESRSARAVYDSLLVARDSWGSVGDSVNLALIESQLGYKALDIDRDLGWEHVRHSLRLAEQIGEREVELQMIGLLAFLHSAEDRPDSSRYWLEEGLVRAVGAHHGPQAARFSSFLSNWYESQGRYALSEELRAETLVYSRELVAGPWEVRYLTETMQGWAQRDCWEAVERLLPRARFAQAEARSKNRKGIDFYGLKLDALEANLHLVRGRTREAESLVASMIDHEAEYAYADPRQHDLYRAAIGDLLLDLGRPEPVVAHLDSVLRNPEVTNNIVVARTLGLQWARARLADGNPRGCLSALEERTSWMISPNGTEIAETELRVRALIELDSLDAARRQLRNGMDEVIQYFSEADPSPGAYLTLNETESLHALAQGLWGSSEEGSYRLGLSWRGLASRIGSGNLGARAGGERATGEALPETAPPAELLRLGDEAAETLDRWIARVQGVHLLFEIRDERICRWIRTSEGVERDTLTVRTPELRALVASLLQDLPVEEGERNVPGKRVQSALRKLTEILVPESVRGYRDVLWTVPDFLRFLPPGILDLGLGSEYEPWLEWATVATFRPAGTTENSETGGRGLVLVDPEVAPQLRRRFPEIVDLPFAEKEVEAALATGVPLDILRGGGATKSALTETWEHVPYLHLATHLVRRPENPYLTFVPLAGGSGANRDDELLEIVDVRRADLRACRIVVLSGCDTGAPASVQDGAAAPTLAEAFLDSGARSVVQTSWRIRDDVAAALIARFTRELLVEGKHPAEALALAQRSDLGNTHPYYWGAFGVQVGLGGLEDW